ncbi:MAG: biotin--[acetyl-CoA-carboxylase] ligase [Pseudohongiellaceae bacterium]
MNPDSLQALLDSRLTTPVRVHWFTEIDSTNAEALRRLRGEDARSGGIDGVDGADDSAGDTLLLAGAQSAGRGRRGRSWVSEPGSGIFLSLIRSLTLPQTALPGLSLVTALVVRDAVAALGGDKIHVKWPNDVLHKRNKLAGILLESHAVATKTSTRPHNATGKQEPPIGVVFGIGINLALSPEAEAQINHPVTDLTRVLGKKPEPEPLIADLIARHSEAVDQYLAEGFAPFQQAWNKADRYFEEDVVVEQNGERLIGRAEGVDDNGALQFITATGKHLISGGEIFPSVRPND